MAPYLLVMLCTLPPAPHPAPTSSSSGCRSNSTRPCTRALATDLMIPGNTCGARRGRAMLGSWEAKAAALLSPSTLLQRQEEVTDLVADAVPLVAVDHRRLHARHSVDERPQHLQRGGEDGAWGCPLQGTP